jgi:uncharacterized protein
MRPPRTRPRATPRGGSAISSCPRTIRSARRPFYRAVFGWTTRERGDGALAFDGAGTVGGVWVTGVPPESDPRAIVYVMVADAQRTLRAVEEAGGRVVEPAGRHLPEITARVADPYGNVLGVYQEPTLAAADR